MELKVKERIGLGAFFFLAGLLFASWASRVPTIKIALNLNEAELGSILFLMPLSSLLGIGTAGWIIERFDSRWPMIWSIILISVFLYMIAIADFVFMFGFSIFMFAFVNSILNVAINTQSISVQKNYGKNITGSFHGLWSFGGILGVAATTILVASDIGIMDHFFYVALSTMITSMLMFRFLIKKDKDKSQQRIIWHKPDPKIMALGVLIFLAAIYEGAMYNWSGVYLKEVVNVKVFSIGYLIFMVFMTTARFTSDWFIHKMGMQMMFNISASIVVIGMLMVVFYPTLRIVLIGFSLVGIGSAAIIPMTYSLAGTSTKFSAGIAISLVSTFAMIGVLVGPSIIGWIAHATSLRISFLFLACVALMIIPVSRRFFKIKEIT